MKLEYFSFCGMLCYMAKVILLTGAAGFIGWKTGEKLLEQGYQVVGVDNLNDYYDVRLKEWRLSRLREREGFSFFTLDIEDLPALEVLFKKNSFSAIINLAARAGVRYSVENPFVYLSTNVRGTLNLLELARKYGVGKFVLASTSSLYAGQPLPFKEELPVNTPISPYAATKKAAEVLCYTYHYLYGMDVSVVRYFTVYGPAGRPDMSIFRFIKWMMEEQEIEIYGDGTQSRDFTYVDDIAQGTVKALRPLGYEIINLGGGKNPISLNRIIEILEELLGVKAKVKYGDFKKVDMKTTWADIGKAKRLLQWEPEVSIEEGLRRTVSWFKENSQLVRKIKVNR